MKALYLFAAAAGIPVVAWLLLSGSEDGGSDDGAGIGGVMLRLLPLSTIAIATATFGVTGLLLGAVGAGSGTTFVGAAGAAGLAAVLNSTLFAYLRRSDSTTDVEEELVGSVGRVVLPITGGHRGRIAVSVRGQQRYLSARALPGEQGAHLESGAPVLIVEVSGGIAGVTRLDQELA